MQKDIVHVAKPLAGPDTSATPLWAYSDYSDWARLLAKNTSKKDLEKQLGVADGDRSGLKRSHLRAIEATTSMSSQSQRRAQSRNALTSNYEKVQALKNALEIYLYYPEQTLESELPPAK